MYSTSPCLFSAALTQAVGGGRGGGASKRTLEQRPYRDRQVLTETGQRLLTETTTKPMRKTETVKCVREGFSSVNPSNAFNGLCFSHRFCSGLCLWSLSGLC